MMFRVLRPNLLKITLRYKSTKSKKISKRNRTINPGINLQMRVLNENQLSEVDDINFEELEADFTHLDLTHKEFVEESRAIKEREQYLMVGRKYFKEKHPNFLTWSDKLLIRHLHSVNPEEWSVEKLSEGFPALPEVIKKVVKSSWTKTNSNKIKNHDLSVVKNWELFKEGKMELPPDLIEHLKKFSSRKLNLEPIQIEEEKKPAVVKVEGEFSEILKSYERLKNKNKEKTSENKLEEDKNQFLNFSNLNKKPKSGTYSIIPPGEYKDKDIVTLDELKRRIGKEVEIGKDLSVDDQLLLKETKNIPIEINRQENLKETQIIELSQLKNTNYLQTEVKKPEKDYKYLEYPEKIIIPKDKLKKGFTYKLNDCFYDSDGLFLYRVPGMEN